MPAVADLLSAQADSVFGGSPVRWAFLVGSQATGAAGPLSDVDVAVSAPGADVLGLRLDLRERVSRVLGRDDVDVLVLEALPPRVVGRLLPGRVLLWSRDEPARVAWESVAFRTAADLDLALAPLDEAVLQRLAAPR